jgi:hypothetical protein
MLHPPQVAIAVSLGTPSPLDRVKGRWYMPSPSVAVQGDGRIGATDAQAMATASASFIETINNQPGIDAFPDLQVCVASTKGQNWPVDEVRVGLVFDTIRTRRNAAQEAYGVPVAIA